jgi:uncharacterized protein YidB (DUF937 family)
MSLLNDLEGSLLKDVEGTAQSALSSALQNGSAGGLGGVLEQLRSSGLGEHVASWLGSGENLPISVDQLRAVLDNDQVKQIASSMGLPIDQVLPLLAQHLPTLAAQQAPAS